MTYVSPAYHLGAAAIDRNLDHLPRRTVLLRLAALIILGYLSSAGATPLNVTALTSDLPSMLAFLIIITICLLPVAGLGVPDVLNNVALVIVGFYFGKRHTAAGE